LYNFLNNKDYHFFLDLYVRRPNTETLQGS
jgi:hypothetical protein